MESKTRRENDEKNKTRKIQREKMEKFIEKECELYEKKIKQIWGDAETMSIIFAHHKNVSYIRSVLIFIIKLT